MGKKFFIKEGLSVTCKFIATGLIIMALVVVLKNRMDLLSFGIAVIVSFCLGGISMALSLGKEFKKLLNTKNSLKRKLERTQKEIDELNKQFDNVTVSSLIDFNEAKNKTTA
mgnify:CR=1 FL=1